MAGKAKKTQTKPKGSTRADRGKAKTAEEAEEEKKSGIRFVYDDGKEIVLDTTTLEIGEQIEVEEITGMPFAQAISSPWIASTKVQAVLAYITRRRSEPDFSYERILSSSEMRCELGVVPPKTSEADG